MYDENRLSYAPDFVETFFCGDSTSAKIELNSLLKRQICLFCNKEPKSIKEISKALGMAEEYIEEAVVSLLKLKLLKNEGRKLITNFCMLPLNISRKAAALKHNYLVDSLFAERINKALYENKSEIMKIVSNSVNDFTFENLLWILYSLFASAVNVRIKDYFPRRQAVKFNINDSYLFPDEYSFSVRADYRFADEKENEEDAALVDYRRGHSSKFLSVKTADFGECHFCRVYELSKEIIKGNVTEKSEIKIDAVDNQVVIQTR